MTLISSTNETRVNISCLEKLMAPKAIAIIGASEEPQKVGYHLFSNILHGGYQGDIYPINPKYAPQFTALTHSPRTRTHTYLPSVEDLPEGGVDMAVIMTPRQTIPDILKQLGKKGVPAAVILTAGFQELGLAGAPMSQAVLDAISPYNIVVVGPNCVGITNANPNVLLNATFASCQLKHGRGAVFSQSGALGINLLNQAARLGLGFSQFVSLGNELQINLSDMLSYWAQHPEVHYIIGYLESAQSLHDLRPFITSITQAKPLILLKAGRSEQAIKAAQSHTGAMTGNDNAIQAFCDQYGIQRVNTMAELLAIAQAFELSKPSMGNRVAVFSNAGGFGVLASDLLDPTRVKPYGLSMAHFSESTLNTLQLQLPKTASATNPVDTTATFPFEHRDIYEAALMTILQDSQVDACLVPLIPLFSEDPVTVLKTLSTLQLQTPKPILAVINLSESDLNDALESIHASGISPVPVYTSVEAALTGLQAIEKHRLWKAKILDTVHTTTLYPEVDKDMVNNLLQKVRRQNRPLLTTLESLEILQAYRIPTTTSHLVHTQEEAVRVANELGYPVAMKINSISISHKTDVGGVCIDIRNQDELLKAFSTLLKLLQASSNDMFDAEEGILVQPFIQKGREVILGARRDHQFGPVVMLGRGGIYTQIDHDIQCRLAPINRLDAREMIEQLKAYPILKGYRGKPGVALDALENALLRLSQLVTDFPDIVEIDINPYITLAATKPGNPGGIAVDSRIVLL